MRKSPKYINYELISEFVGLFGGIFLLCYGIDLARNSCDSLFGYRTASLLLLFYFMWIAIIVFISMAIHRKLEIYFSNLNGKWWREWMVNVNQNNDGPMM